MAELQFRLKIALLIESGTGVPRYILSYTQSVVNIQMQKNGSTHLNNEN